jgi:hypothetical protein
MREVDESVILSHYRQHEARAAPPLGRPLVNMTLTNTATGIGDAIVALAPVRNAACAGRTMSVYVPGAAFSILRGFVPYAIDEPRTFWVAADRLLLGFDLGNGHFIQRLQRAFGFEPDLKPRGCVVVDGEPVVPGRVVLHLEAGPHQAWQKANIHPRAREVYPEHLAIIERFVRRHLEFEFVEIGYRSRQIPGVRDATGVALDESIRTIATCEYFMGIMSGPLHIAAALNKRIITIVNFPAAPSIVLPTLKDIDQVESEWFYPQAVLLHQDEDSMLVPRFTEASLERAFAGEIYPYWSDRYLSLIREAGS